MDKTLLAQQAAQATITTAHAYMRAHPDSELHRQGKMFGILVCTDRQGTVVNLQAFSAMLDGTYHHKGFVPPVYEMTTPPVGSSREESQRLQRLLFASYRFTNIHGESRNLLEIFAQEKPILSLEEWFSKKDPKHHFSSLPPAGAGECCAPKLLKYAIDHHLQPLALAEFWVGAPSGTELRQEGVFYPPCSGKCIPILKHMLKGVDLLILRSDGPHRQADIRSVDILHEDEWLMVINKPAGVLSVPGKTDEPSITQFLCIHNHYAYLQPVHRLDQDTSGILVLAKTPDTYKTLQAYFQRRDILKHYEAILVPDGEWHKADEGTISLPLLPNPYDRPRQMVNHEHGKPAITTYRIREIRSNGNVLVDFYPKTGRTHQLRVHAAHPDGLNAPILGDRLYGRHDMKANRLYLHATEISFVHPATKKEMHFCIPSCF
ncbi:MAG: RluA family pseudouridine synthase [Paludibacteraceae bacterium]|nr:RluA family pseudouridine synthase [Paludibacteraceae bacterium]